MGGYGSTRWGSVRTKYAAEDCRKLSIFFLRPYLQPGNSNTLTWSRGGEKIGSISYWVWGEGYKPERIKLIYTRTPNGGKPVDYDYFVNLATSEVYRGGRRYWFICPGCERRVGCLYLAPGGQLFTCRHCNGLSYKSRQDGYGELGIFRYILASMQDKYPPGMTPRELKRLLDYSGWLG